jgi:hypothetical protein
VGEIAANDEKMAEGGGTYGAVMSVFLFLIGSAMAEVDLQVLRLRGDLVVCE